MTPGPEPLLENLALNRPARQSSVSPWSTDQDPEIDARIANNGDISAERYFHTAAEPNPWWQVDLEAPAVIRSVRLHNRRQMAGRLRHFTLLGSIDGMYWRPIFNKADDAIFGQGDDAPYVVDVGADTLARYVRVRLNGHDNLHFRECEVFGFLPDPGLRDHLMQAQAPVAISADRAGSLVEIGGFTVFVDHARYGEQIVRFLNRGIYELPERGCVTRFVHPRDRVIEAGTAIGLVAMTAACIVGASDVLTFDANPDILDDARANFHRNGMSAITARAGVLRNRASLATTAADQTAEFHIHRNFWSSSLSASPDAPDTIRTVRVPVLCLEDQIAAHRANVLICDIEGGEVDLLTEADLSGIRLIILESHYWATGEAPADAMVRKLILDGFSIHLGASGNNVSVFRR